MQPCPVALHGKPHARRRSDHDDLQSNGRTWIVCAHGGLPFRESDETRRRAIIHHRELARIRSAGAMQPPVAFA